MRALPTLFVASAALALTSAARADTPAPPPPPPPEPPSFPEAAPLAPPPALAPLPRPSPPAIDITVRGDRVPPPERSGASVNVVTRPMLDALPGGDTQPLPNVLATQPGFVNDTFGLLHTRAADGGVSYVVDGVPILTIPLGQFQNLVPMRLVEALRITTGGFPAEYGYGLGAVIDVTTRHAAGSAGEAQLLYGSYQTVTPSFNYSQEVGKGSFLVGGNFETTTRGIDPPAASPILHDDLQTGNAFARGEYALGDHDRIALLAMYMQSFYQVPIDPSIQPLSNAPAGAVRGPDAYGNVPTPFIPYDANPTEAERDLFVAVSYTHKVGGAALHVAPYVHETYGDYSCNPSGTLGATADKGSTCADLRRDALHEGVAADDSWKLGQHQAWKLGTLLDVAEQTGNYTSYARDDASPLGGADPSRTVSGKDVTDVFLGGVYAQDRITLGKWTIFPGARLDMEQATYSGTSEPALLLVGPSARLGSSYAITDDLVVHAFAGYLWQPPVVLDGPTAARIISPQYAGQTLPVDLKAETDWTGEVGIADRILHRVNLGLTAWGRIVEDQLDRQVVGATNLYVSYNFARGRAAGAEAWTNAAIGRYLDGFGNVGLQQGQGQGVETEKFLFTAAQIADNSWVTLDHVQTWTVNGGLDLHDGRGTTHLSGLFNFGSGLRTGFDNTEKVPSHCTLDLTLRHRFEVTRRLQPEVAVDVFNVFDELYASRLGNGYVGSAYGALRHGDVRLTVPFGS